MTSIHAALALSCLCTTLAAQDLDAHITDSPSGGATLHAEVRDQRGGSAVVWLAIPSPMTAVPTPFGPVLIDPRLILGGFTTPLDAQGLGAIGLAIPIDIELLGLELQGAVLDPLGFLRMTDADGVGFARPATGPTMTGSHDGATGHWEVEVTGAVPGSTIYVRTDGLDVPLRIEGSAIVDANGRAVLSGSRRLDGDAGLVVQYREPGATQSRDLGRIPGAAH